MKCVDCDYWDFRFETDSLLMGYCTKKKRLVDGTLDPSFNYCDLNESCGNCKLYNFKIKKCPYGHTITPYNVWCDKYQNK